MEISTVFRVRDDFPFATERFDKIYNSGTIMIRLHVTHILSFCFTGTFILTNTLFWPLNALFLTLDIMAPEWLHKYKVQPDKNVPVSDDD